MIELHIRMFVRGDGFMRAYKYLDKPVNSTAQSVHFVYSKKAKRYVLAAFYFYEWSGNQIEKTDYEYQNLRQAIARIGLDLR